MTIFILWLIMMWMFGGFCLFLMTNKYFSDTLNWYNKIFRFLLAGPVVWALYIIYGICLMFKNLYGK